jgi:hypothetical protein
MSGLACSQLNTDSLSMWLKYEKLKPWFIRLL